MKKVLLTAAILFAGTLGFYSCTEEEPAEPTTNVGTQNPDDQKEPEKEPGKEEVDEEAATDFLPPFKTGTDGGSPCFPASFFKTADGKEALINVGYGFHINSPLEQTKFCFTTKTRTQPLKAKEGPRTDFATFYTRNDYEYNTLKSNEFSASVGFLNTFSISGKRKETMTTSTSQATERLIFVATCDFGQFGYDQDLVLTKEANELLKSGEFEKFIDAYGTHYIKGCRKVARIIVEVTKKQSSQTDKDFVNNRVDASVKYKGWSGDFSFENNKENCSINKMSECEVKVTLQGPTANLEDYGNFIKKLTEEGSENIVAAAEEYLRKQVGKFTEEQSVISEYFVCPFTLNGCQDIYWSTQKEDALSSINENHLSALRLSNMIKDFTSRNSIDIIVDGIGLIDNNSKTNIINYYLSEYKEKYSEEMPEEYKSMMKENYSSGELNNEWSRLKSKVDSYIPKLQAQYEECSNIKLNIHSPSTDYTDEIKELFNEYNELYHKAEIATINVIEDGINAFLAKEVEILNKRPTINLTNQSKYTFVVEIEGRSPITMKGGERIGIKVDPGYYYLKATQQDGYIFYATKVEKTIIAEEGGSYTFSFTD